MSDRVLAFDDHPDDAEFMAADMLAVLTRAGREIHMATRTGGEVGSATDRPTEICKIRLAETHAAAQGTDSHFH